MKTVVIGAGPVGALAAIYAAKRGDNVEVYELRPDLRHASTVPLNFTKSINLALSERGIHSIAAAGNPGLLKSILNETIPMHGRMIHGRNAKHAPFQASQAYDVHGRSIRAVDRGGLNDRLLDELESLPNVTFFFQHKLTGADFKKNIAWVERQDEKEGSTNRRHAEIEISFDLLIGADGAHSAARYHMMKFARMDYKQEYIDTLWCEFQISPLMQEHGPDFKISPNHLHIWPAGDFMFIAIPSLDKSFTCTLFMPSARFEVLSGSPSSLPAFFDEFFPGVVPSLIDSESLITQFRSNPHLPLISIKCSPHSYSSSCVILGDAAHAMVPFYGQGMNAGMEDVRVLYDFLDSYARDTQEKDLTRAAREQALRAYSKQRVKDAAAINDLALQNYVEMRSSVTSPLYRARKWLEEHIDIYFPNSGWATQYSRVSFGNERYSDVELAVRKQSRVLAGVISTFGLGLAASSIIAWRWIRN